MTNSTIIICTTAAEHLVSGLRKKAAYPVLVLGKNKDGSRYFPDGEIYVKMPVLKGVKRVVIVHAGMPDPNGGLIELEIMLASLCKWKVNIELFFTYFPYGMQDTEGPNEVNFAEQLVKKFTLFYQVKKIYVIDAHFENKHWVHKYPVIFKSAYPMLLEAAKQKYPQLFLVVPDKGEQMRLGIEGFDKKRINSFDITVSDKKGILERSKGSIVAVIDDLIETGQTLLEVHKFLSKSKKVIALASHGVLPLGVKKVKNSYDDLFLTDSIKNSQTNVSIINLISPVIEK